MSLNINPAEVPMTLTGSYETELQWFVMRDLKRSNAKNQAWQQLQEAGFEVFTPMHWVVVKNGHQTQRRQVPVIPDLLFVHTRKDILDKEVNETATLQYRFVRGAYCKPLTVSDREMNQFIRAVSAVEKPEYLSPDELTPDMLGRKIRIIGGPLDGSEGNLLKLRGLRKKKLIVSIPSLLVACVEVQSEFIELI